MENHEGGEPWLAHEVEREAWRWNTMKVQHHGVENHEGKPRQVEKRSRWSTLRLSPRGEVEHPEALPLR